MPDAHVDARAVVLCGGQGMRLRPYTTVLPKPLMPIGDRPILEVGLESLRRCGFRRVTMCVGHLGELIQTFFGNGERVGLDIEYVFEDQPLGTIGPLAFVKNLGESFVVMNGDLLTDINPANLLKKRDETNADLVIATTQRQVRIDYGVIEVGEDNRTVIGFREKPVSRYEVSTGVYAMSRRVLDHFKPGEAFGFDHLVLSLLARNRPVERVLHTGEWLDIGRLEDYEAAQNDPRWGKP
jgi:NDP-sugar pyrophosphorylase family protein